MRRWFSILTLIVTLVVIFNISACANRSKNYIAETTAKVQIEAALTESSDEYELANREQIIAAEEQRGQNMELYGQTITGYCIFEVTSYQINGDTIMLTGNIHESGFGSEEYLKTLEVGDMVADYGVVTKAYDGHHVESQVGEGEEMDVYYLGSDFINGFYSMGGEGVKYQLIQSDVTLQADNSSRFIDINQAMNTNTLPNSVREGLEINQVGEPTDYDDNMRWYLQINVLSGSHIIELEDVISNYAG